MNDLSEVKFWVMQNFGLEEGEIIGAVMIIAVCILVCLISYMKRKNIKENVWLEIILIYGPVI